MAIVLALITSGLWGTSDFFGGLATRRTPVATVMLWAHGVGLVAIAAAAPLIAETVTVRDLWLGALAGVIGLVGLLLLYRGLSRGPMAVVAPLSALMAAVVPVVWGLGTSDPISNPALVGLALGLAAVVAVSWEGNLDPDGPPITGRVIGEAAIAGSCFGSIVLIYDATSADAAPWPIVSGRLVTTLLLIAFIFHGRHQVSAGPALGFAVVAGLGDTCANLTLLLATSEAIGSSELSIVAVIAAFFPAATVLWARVMLNERLGPIRIGGLILGLLAITLMTLA